MEEKGLVKIRCACLLLGVVVEVVEVNDFSLEGEKSGQNRRTQKKVLYLADTAEVRTI